MAIRYEHCETIRTTADRAFAMIDDLPQTSKWLPPCVSLEKTESGPNAVGDKLNYVFKQGGKTARMDGEIIDRIPGERLHCKYFDNMFDVSVDLRVASSAEGALTTHVVEITPKTFFGKLLTPLIRLGLRKQTRDAAANLKKLLESTSA